MNRRTRVAVAAGVTLGAIVAGASVAEALWRASHVVDATAVATGAVRFAAQAQDDAVPVISLDGSAVSLTLPAARVREVLDQNLNDVDPLTDEPVPVFWRFDARGAALGIAGLEYTVTAVEQLTDAGADLSSGIAQAGTVLAKSTMKVYPASAGGDCSTVPETPAGSPPEQNVFPFDQSDRVLQPPGSNLAGAEQLQQWCVALSWNFVDAGRYANHAEVVATAVDHSQAAARTEWDAALGYAPMLDETGTYVNSARVHATAQDLTLSSGETEWRAHLHPDPSDEPAVRLTLDPRVTSLNPTVTTGIRPQW